MLSEEGGSLFPIEIKAGRTVATDMLKNLLYFLRLPGNLQKQSMLLHAGDDAYERQGIAVRPWYALG